VVILQHVERRISASEVIEPYLVAEAAQVPYGVRQEVLLIRKGAFGYLPVPLDVLREKIASGELKISKEYMSA